MLVGDSSDDARYQEDEAICARYDFVTLKRHSGKNVAAARNFLVGAADAEVLISIDDDIRIEPDALDELIAAYQASPKPCSVAGAVAWDGLYHEPVAIRLIGYGRPARPDEKPDFLVTALFAFPRELGAILPWNERIATCDDVFIGGLWRSHGINLGFAPRARATHDVEHQQYGIDSEKSHIYANLFIAVHGTPNLLRALSFEFLGFLAGAKLHCRTPRSTVQYIGAWLSGNLRFLRDTRYLRGLVRRQLPPDLQA